MRVTSGLIIDDPWIEYILNGTKDWEMRSTSTAKRGWIGLIRKGTGQVHGVALLEGAGEPLSDTEMIATFAHHRIPAVKIRNGEVANWRVPWKLSEVRRLAKPVPYQHKSGSVIWVNLSESEGDAIADALSVDDALWVDQGVEPPDDEADHRSRSTSTSGESGSFPQEDRNAADQRQVEITAGNLQHNHIYLRNFMDLFPEDAIGGSNRSVLAARLLTLEAEGLSSIETDIAGDKKIFRDRGWVGAFFRKNEVGPGDRVGLTRLEPYRFRLDVVGRGG